MPRADDITGAQAGASWDWLCSIQGNSDSRVLTGHGGTEIHRDRFKLSSDLSTVGLEIKVLYKNIVHGCTGYKIQTAED